MCEITGRGVTAPAMAVTIEERRAFQRVTRKQIADLVGKPILNVRCQRMQKDRDVGNLIRRKRRESRHPPLQPPILDNRTDHISFIVVQHQSRAHKIRPRLSMSVIAVTKPAGRHKNFPPAFRRFFVDRRAAHHGGKHIACILLLRSVFLLSIRRLLFLGIGRLVGLPRTYRRKQKQDSDSTEVTIEHAVSPGLHDFRFFMYSKSTLIASRAGISVKGGSCSTYSARMGAFLAAAKIRPYSIAPRPNSVGTGAPGSLSINVVRGVNPFRKSLMCSKL